MRHQLLLNDVFYAVKRVPSLIPPKNKRFGNGDGSLLAVSSPPHLLSCQLWVEEHVPRTLEVDLGCTREFGLSILSCGLVQKYTLLQVLTTVSASALHGKSKSYRPSTLQVHTWKFQRCYLPSLPQQSPSWLCLPGLALC